MIFLRGLCLVVFRLLLRKECAFSLSSLLKWFCLEGAPKIAPHSVSLLAERRIFPFEFVERHFDISFVDDVHFFKVALQFTHTVSGGSKAAVAGVITSNRFPSVVTSYWKTSCEPAALA